LAARIAAHPPVPKLAFFQVELDQHQFSTYRFVPGVAQTSLAHRTAARLGVTREELLALIEASKRAQRAREEGGSPSDEGLSTQVSAPHMVRASATDEPRK